MIDCWYLGVTILFLNYKSFSNQYLKFAYTLSWLINWQARVNGRHLSTLYWWQCILVEMDQYSYLPFTSKVFYQEHNDWGWPIGAILRKDNIVFGMSLFCIMSLLHSRQHQFITGLVVSGRDMVGWGRDWKNKRMSINTRLCNNWMSTPWHHHLCLWWCALIFCSEFLFSRVLGNLWF